jgi:glycosyltransferase involved in cell wall biosynthesis
VSAIDWRVSESTSVPTVSVIMATYNWSDALRCAVQSILLQSLREMEIIVVGDAYTDDSRAITDSFSNPRIRWINLDQHHGH